MAKVLTEKQQELFEKCYGIWPPGRKQRGACEKSWKSLNPDEILANEILQTIIAWNHYWRSVNQDLKYVRLFSTWLNQRGWRDEIPSVSGETKKEMVTEKCQCGRFTIGPLYSVCDSCIRRELENSPNTQGMTRSTHIEQLTKLGIINPGEKITKEELTIKCKEMAMPVLREYLSQVKHRRLKLSERMETR